MDETSRKMADLADRILREIPKLSADERAEIDAVNRHFDALLRFARRFVPEMLGMLDDSCIAMKAAMVQRWRKEKLSDGKQPSH